jgi:hypothetical protein
MSAVRDNFYFDTPNQGRKLHLLVTARDAAGSEGTAYVTVNFI